jgi:RimJ/RimL family protein N-acetyltransferase
LRNGEFPRSDPCPVARRRTRIKIAEWPTRTHAWHDVGMVSCWLHPAVVVRESTIDGRGLFATEPLAEGTVVVRLRGRHVTSEELAQLFADAAGQPDAPYIDTIAIDEDLHLVLAPGQAIHYGNHSCDPSLWHGDAYTLVARRDIAAGDEVTVDYATQTTQRGFRMPCRCAAADCRGAVSGDDWRSPQWQHRYGKHVVPAVARRMGVMVARMTVQLRAVEDADIDVFFEHQADPVATAMAAMLPRGREPFVAHWAKIRANDNGVLRTILLDGVVAGNVVSWVQDGQRLVGYFVGRQHWGRGVASQALAQFVAEVSDRPLWAHVAVHNIGSIRVLEKTGFQRDRAAEAQAPEAEDGVHEYIYFLS